MAKKRFTDDLFGLFEEPQEAPAPAPREAEEVERVEVKVPATSPRARKKLSSKNFTADLDDFLSDSFEREKTPRKVKDIPAGEPPRPGPRRRRKTGLDLLIRSTVKDEDRSPRGGNTAETKRVTLIFNKKHLAELKDQAKERGMYLKDVV
ncbi:MAG: hypothetical protein AAFN92_21645, partial [Bacteroidota bacterium]